MLLAPRSRKSPMIIINADDFGRKTEVNKAIIKSFQQGYCSSATIMPNMPAFEEAANLVHENRLQNNVGLHLTLRDAPPLTEGMKRFRAFCDEDGMLCRVTAVSPLFLSDSEKHALAGEIRAQIARCRAFGLPLTHLDSHCHTHTNIALIDVVIAVALQQKIPYIRILRNCGPNIGHLKKAYKDVLNRRLKANRLAGTTYFGSIADYAFLTGSMGGLQGQESMEVMVHPVLDRAGRVIDLAFQRPMSEVVGRIASYKKAVSYASATCVESSGPASVEQSPHLDAKAPISESPLQLR
jgi:chitin disaccharide deacetylase